MWVQALAALIICSFGTVTATLDRNCPLATFPARRFYELQVAVTSDATICKLKHHQALSVALATLLNEAFSQELFVWDSETHVCRDPVRRRRELNSFADRVLPSGESSNTSILASSFDSSLGPSTETLHFDSSDYIHNQTGIVPRRNLQWGRYVYRGGAKCMFCSPDNSDWRLRRRLGHGVLPQHRRLACEQEDLFLPINGFLPVNWNGKKLKRMFRIPKKASMVTIMFEVTQTIGGQLKWFEFFSHNVHFRVRMDRRHLQTKHFTNDKDITWAYKTLQYNKKTGRHKLSVAIQFPDRYFRNDGTIGANLIGKRTNHNGKVKINDLIVMASRYCDGKGKGDRFAIGIRRRLSRYLTQGLIDRLDPKHCMSDRNIEVYVNLSKKDSWPDAKPRCY